MPPDGIRKHNLRRRAVTDIIFKFLALRIQDINRDNVTFSSLTRLPKTKHTEAKILPCVHTAGLNIVKQIL